MSKIWKVSKISRPHSHEFVCYMDRTEYLKVSLVTLVVNHIQLFYSSLRKHIYFVNNVLPLIKKCFTME